MDNKGSISVKMRISVVCACISAALMVPFFIMGLKNGDGFLLSLIEAPFCGLLVGGLIPGILHAPAVYRKICTILFIPFGWLFAFFIVAIAIIFGGGIFMIVDTVKFILAKKQK